jgi:hypothetical protein
MLLDLPEVLDFRHDSQLIEKCGVSIETLMNEMGASP